MIVDKLEVGTLNMAVNGNTEAMASILEFFDEEINKLATKFFVDGSGKVISYVDPEVKRCLQNYVLSETNDFEMEG